MDNIYKDIYKAITKHVDINEKVFDVIARDKKFPYTRFFYKEKDRVIAVSQKNLGDGYWKTQEKDIGTVEDFLSLVDKKVIKNIISTRPLGKDKEDINI